ncbi:MAG: phosphopyruvate hydratase [Acidobacteriota bacterium]|nr:phosphopyruvate hydratase [Acidobacteriota bacterium]
MKIRRVRALEVLDSRGNPTVEAEVLLEGGIRATAQAPSGASTGTHEAVELRDGDEGRFAGKGVLRAVRNAGEVLGPAVAGMDAERQQEVDARLIATDGASDKSRLGANAILAISCAAARAASMAKGVPLWRHLAEVFGTAARMPVPMINVISGGLHAGRQLEFQDFLVIPRDAGDMMSGLEATVRVHRMTARILKDRGYLLTGVADEGGWGPRLESNEMAASILREAIEEAGARMDIALDVAATHFFENGRYRVGGSEMSAAEIAKMLGGWIGRYGITSIEDPCSEDDWEGWRAITRELGPRLPLIGDDLFVTNLGRLERGIAEQAGNAVLVKMNQAGTLTETFAVIHRAREAGFGAVISARSGETEDAFLADLAVASGAGQIKIGSITRSERLAKYNRLIEIERWDLG